MRDLNGHRCGSGTLASELAAAAQQPEALARMAFACRAVNCSDPLAMWRRSSLSHTERMIPEGECAGGGSKRCPISCAIA